MVDSAECYILGRSAHFGQCPLWVTTIWFQAGISGAETGLRNECGTEVQPEIPGSLKSPSLQAEICNLWRV